MIKTEYDNPGNWLAWEGGYVGTTYDTEELLGEVIGIELPGDDEGKLLRALSEAIDSLVDNGAYPLGEAQNQPFQLSFNPALKVEFQGSRVTSDDGLILVRELDERLGFSDLIAEYIIDPRGKNTQFPRLPPESPSATFAADFSVYTSDVGLDCVVCPDDGGERCQFGPRKSSTNSDLASAISGMPHSSTREMISSVS